MKILILATSFFFIFGISLLLFKQFIKWVWKVDVFTGALWKVLDTATRLSFTMTGLLLCISLVYSFFYLVFFVRIWNV